MGARPVLTEVAERQQKSVTGKLEQKTALGRNSSRGKTRGDFRTDGRQALQPSTNREITAPKAEPEAHLSTQGKGLALTQRQDLDEEKLAVPRGRNQASGVSKAPKQIRVEETHAGSRRAIAETNYGSENQEDRRRLGAPGARNERAGTLCKPAAAGIGSEDQTRRKPTILLAGMKS
jgi:hypothetical protein